jgi:hypothetical protein
MTSIQRSNSRWHPRLSLLQGLLRFDWAIMDTDFSASRVVGELQQDLQKAGVILAVVVVTCET